MRGGSRATGKQQRRKRGRTPAQEDAGGYTRGKIKDGKFKKRRIK